jgi:adenine-specific DNA-methyltransferase
LFTAPDDLVLDYHLGSGTTAAVAHKMKRRYIGIEQINYLENDATHRLKNVIAGDSSGVSKAVGWKGGGDFVYLELAERNPKFLKSIGEAKTNKELLAIWDDLAATSFLSYKVDIKKFNQAASDFVELSLEDARSVLFEVVDKNAIYVNVSEIHDKSNGLSIEEVNVTKSFYGVS